MKKNKVQKKLDISQKKFFLKNEGNAYFLRNKNEKKIFKKDFLTKSIIKKLTIFKKKNILEIGCGKADRLNYLKNNFSNNNYFGIDPSSAAIKYGKKLNSKLNLKIGDASKLKFNNNKFDIVVFGFCLYLCDDDDLYKISSECFRVLKNKGFIIIQDFINSKVIYNKYHHHKNIKSRKMNYIKMFDWHPKIRLEKKIKYITYGEKRIAENFITVAVLKKDNFRY